MELGVCYYPEHWPEETWRPDAARMKALGIRWVRIGEFAWSRLEPGPGELRFDWLDRAIDTLGNAGLEVVLGTPTATPPKWLCDQHGDFYPVDASGRVRGFGSRRHYCVNAPSYREETRRIVTLLAERYGKHPAVRAWQTDNEYGCHGTVRCYCAHCRRGFQAWLKRKYGDIRALNEAWWNVFWSMELRDFGEVELPHLTVTEPNPSCVLDYYRFASDAVVAYNRLQVEILRQHSPGRPVTHNAMIFFGDYDVYKLAEDLDFISWDNYPLGMLELAPLPEDIKRTFLRVGHPDLIGFNHDLYYGVKDKPFWVMEQQPGQVNWAPSNPLPAPGAVRLWSHQAFAHGAEVVSYFRWRAANGAQELMHAGLNVYDGTPDRASAEVTRVRDEIRELEGVAGEECRADVAILFDYENLWASELQPHAQGWSYWSLLGSYYGALRALGIDVAFTHPRRELRRFKVVFAPALHLVDEALATHLRTFISAGGTLVVGPRSGAKRPSGVVWAPAPGPLRELMGVRIDHVDALRPGLVEHVSLADERYRYHTWAELLTPEGAETLASYETDAYAGAAAVTRHAVGAGRCYTVGLWGDEALHRTLFARVLAESGVDVAPLPEGVRLKRRGAGRLAMNFLPTEVQVAGERLGPWDARWLEP